MRADEDWRVVGRIVRFEHYLQLSRDRNDQAAGPGVRVELELGLTSADDRRLVFSATYREEEFVSGGVDVAAQVMGEVLGRIFERFAADAALRVAGP